MKNAVLCLALACGLASGAARATAQFEEFTYQGRLLLNGQPANGTYPMTFTLFDAATGGNPVGATVSKPSVSVVGGGFGLNLAYPGAFHGQQLWLEIAVNGQTLALREAVTAAPVAQFALAGAHALEYSSTDPSSAAPPPSTYLASAGPFDFYGACALDSGSGTVTARLLVDSASSYDVRSAFTLRTNDAGAAATGIDNATGTSGINSLQFSANAGSFVRSMQTTVLHSRANPNAIATVTVYVAADARAASTGCTVQGTVVLGI